MFVVFLWLLVIVCLRLIGDVLYIFSVYNFFKNFLCFYIFRIIGDMAKERVLVKGGWFLGVIIIFN